MMLKTRISVFIALAGITLQVNAAYSPEKMQAFYDGALKIAEYKMKEGEDYLKKHPPKVPLKPRLATGGQFSGLFQWDTVFCVLWAKHEPKRFPITESLDNFYALQEPDGYICREFNANGEPCYTRDHPIAFNPPIFSWAEWELFEHGVTDTERLKAVYPNLKKHHEFCRKTYRRPTGLFFGCAMGGGMDDLPRLPIGHEPNIEAGIPLQESYFVKTHLNFGRGLIRKPLYRWNRQMDWIDISAQMAFNALNLSRIAEKIGKSDDAAAFRKEHREIADLINTRCYDETRGFYFDADDTGIIPRYHAGAFWVLLAEVVPKERVPGFLAVLKDEKRFNRPVPFPTLAANEPEYKPEDGYWLGSVWPPTTYVALRGLRAVGEDALAREFALRYYNANAALYFSTNTIWENISPEQCERPKKRAMRDFCGWGALAPIAVYKEFIEKN